MNKQFGQNVRKLREMVGMTQEALADDVGIYCTYLSRIENGTANPTLLVIVALAQCLGVTPDVLFE
jgi:transcriptional regulator with XRE-family HTH domain